jgi:thiamine-phosphate pyrophosphorylase
MAIICLITDRLRLASALRQPAEDALPLLLTQLQGAVRGGVDLIQIRERDMDGGALIRLVRCALEIVTGSPTRVVVNDRIDVTIASGAHGVHLRAASVTSRHARSMLSSDSLVGRSVHIASDATTAGPVDYMIAGTAFGTMSKSPSATLMGTEGLAEIVDAASSTPVLAVGGVTRDRITEIRATGAAGIAAIGAFIPATGVSGLAGAVAETTRQLRDAFDGASGKLRE